jgi:ribosomal protein L18E
LSRITRILTKDRLFTDKKPEEVTGIKKVVNAVTRFFKRAESKKVDTTPNRFTSRIVAVVGTVTNDNRLLQVPQGIRVCALRFTAGARARINKAHG